MKDFYNILGVNRNASVSEIKKAYYTKAKKYHPDVSNGDKKLEEKFKDASFAYEVLSDPNKKKQYDQFGTVGDQPQPRPNGNWNVFNQFFSGASSGPKQPQRRAINPDIRSSLRITLADAIFGCDVTQEFKRAIACKKCQTTGVSIKSSTNCTSCNGKGRITIRPTPNVSFESLCGACGGSGQIFKQCAKCDGRGYFQKIEKIKIRVPANLKNNSNIRLQEKGNVVYNNNGDKYTGSHYLVVNYPLSDQGVTLKGSNLYVITQIPIDKILAEDEMTVKIFDKKDISFKLNSNQDFNKQYVVKADFLNGGSIFIKVLPKIPSKDISEDKRKSLVKALRETYGESKSTVSPTIHWA